MHAEEKLGIRPEWLLDISLQSTERIIHELGTHQIELEMQNEELRLIRQNLEKSQRRYADLYDFAPVGYFTIDRSGIISEANHTAEVLLGWPKRALIGSRFLDYVLMKDHLVFKSHNDKVFKKQTLQSCEISLQVCNGDISVQLQSIAADIESGSPLFMRTAVIDITERKLARHERDQALAGELVARQKIEENRRILQQVQKAREVERSSIAREIHDELGQLLTAVRMDLSRLEKKYRIAALSESVASMTQIIDTTIDTVRKITGELRPNLLEHLGLAAAIKRHAHEFQRRTSLKCRVEIHPRRIVLDKDLSMALFRIMQESLTNIARHADAREVRITLDYADDTVTLEVSDDGKGLTRKQIINPKSFGLIGIRERTRSFNGEVTFTGSGEKGTTVKVRIPANGRSLELSPKGMSLDEIISNLSGTEVILLAENNEVLRGLKMDILSHFGYTVIEAVDVSDAVSKFRENKEKIHLILLDGIGPRMNGVGAFREIKAVRPEIKFIFVSRHPEHMFAEDGLPAGEAEFILKPVTPAEILKRIRKLLEN